MNPSRNQVVTEGIVLSRTNFGEADRIITMLTSDRGKVTLMAKGVRKIKSKLAGGIELFSISQISYLPGKGEIHTLISSRLQKHYGQIVKDISRTMLGYELLKRINRATEDATESEYFDLMKISLASLDGALVLNLIELWFDAQLLRLAGHQPNLASDLQGKRLQADQLYTFDFDNMSFVTAEQGIFSPAHIKFLRLVFGLQEPLALGQITDADQVIGPCAQLVATMRHQFIRA
ncbi:MAG: DNA repair protein RecO [Candidatus Saccharibacteria bacterium]